MPALARRSRLLHHWRAYDASMKTIGNLSAVFARTGTATALDSQGVSYTARDAQPRFQWYDLDSDGVRETPTLLMGSADVCYWPYLALPRTGTLYIQFILEQAIGSGDATFGVIYIGNSGNSGARWSIKHVSGTAGFIGQHNNGTTDRLTAGLTGAVLNDKLELLLQLNSDGSIQLFQSINGAAETSTALSSTNALTTAWSDTRLYVAGLGANNPGAIATRVIKVAPAIRTLAQMRVAF